MTASTQTRDFILLALLATFLAGSSMYFMWASVELLQAGDIPSTVFGAFYAGLGFFCASCTKHAARATINEFSN